MDQPVFERDPSDPKKQELNPLLKLALELGPLLVFFFANTRGEWLIETWPVLGTLGGPIFVATGLFMVATAVALVVSWLLTRTLPIMPLVSGVVVFIFGALTLYLHDEVFIKMKPTIVNTLFGVTLLGGLAFGQSLLRYVFGEVYRLAPKGWHILTLRWGVFFLFLAVLNEVVWRTQTDDVWVAFKVWATMPITIIFAAFQLPILRNYAPEPVKPIEAITPPDPLP